MLCMTRICDRRVGIACIAGIDPEQLGLACARGAKKRIAIELSVNCTHAPLLFSAAIGLVFGCGGFGLSVTAMGVGAADQAPMMSCSSSGLSS